MSARTLPNTLAITGINGFVGRRIAERLLDDPDPPRIVALDLRVPPRLEGRVTHHRVDLTEPTADSALAEILAKEECDGLLHAAFRTLPDADVEAAHELEVVGSLHAINAAAASGLRKLVVTSTAEVYGARADNPTFLSEDRPLRPLPGSHAARDRAEMESLLRVFAARHPDMLVSSLRPCWIVGPEIETVATRHFSASRVPTVLGFDPLLQLLHEEDWIDAVELALTRDVRGPFNLAAEGPLPLSTLLRRADRTNLALPHPLLYRLAYLPHLRRSGDPPEAFYDALRFTWTVDTRRARVELGFAPRYSTAEAWTAFATRDRIRSYR